MSLTGLYDALLSGHLDTPMHLAHRHDDLSISLRKLSQLSGEQIAAMINEPTACLSFAAHYSQDESSAQGRKFAAMCGESACLGAMLTEVSTPYILQQMSRHMYHNPDPNIARPQDNLPQMQVGACLVKSPSSMPLEASCPTPCRTLQRHHECSSQCPLQMRLCCCQQLVAPCDLRQSQLQGNGTTHCSQHQLAHEAGLLLNCPGLLIFLLIFSSMCSQASTLPLSARLRVGHAQALQQLPVLSPKAFSLGQVQSEGQALMSLQTGHDGFGDEKGIDQPS